MTAHTCKELTPGCYRCDLNRDEIEAAREDAEKDAQAAWLAYRDHPSRRWMKPRQMRRREFVAGYLTAEGFDVEAQP